MYSCASATVSAPLAVLVLLRRMNSKCKKRDTCWDVGFFPFVCLFVYFSNTTQRTVSNAQRCSSACVKLACIVCNIIFFWSYSRPLTESLPPGRRAENRTSTREPWIKSVEKKRDDQSDRQSIGWWWGGRGRQSDKLERKKNPRDRTDETTRVAALSMLIGHWLKEAGNCWVAQEGSVKSPHHSIIITAYLLRDTTDVPAGTTAGFTSLILSIFSVHLADSSCPSRSEAFIRCQLNELATAWGFVFGCRPSEWHWWYIPVNCCQIWVRSKMTT